MNLMARRRALMAAKGENGPTPIYKLSNRAFNVEAIPTGIKPFAANLAVTILMDITITTNITSGDGSAARLFSLWDSTNSQFALLLAKYAANSDYYQARWMGSGYQSGLVRSQAGRKLIAITHEANSDAIVMSGRSIASGVPTLTKTYTRTFKATSGQLNIGESGQYALPVGTINKFEIYDQILPSDTINDFLEG